MWCLYCVSGVDLFMIPRRTLLAFSFQLIWGSNVFMMEIVPLRRATASLSFEAYFPLVSVLKRAEQLPRWRHTFLYQVIDCWTTSWWSPRADGSTFSPSSLFTNPLIVRYAVWTISGEVPDLGTYWSNDAYHGLPAVLCCSHLTMLADRLKY